MFCYELSAGLLSHIRRTSSMLCPFDGFDPFDKPFDLLRALSLSKRLRADRLTASRLRASHGTANFER